MTRKKDPAETRTPPAEMEQQGAQLPAFEPVPRKFRHDGWMPERQKAFIAALEQYSKGKEHDDSNEQASCRRIFCKSQQE